MYRTVIAATLVFFVFVAVVLVRTPYTVHASGGNLSGYAWSSNVGWISFSGTASNGTSYGVLISSADNQTLSGYAWNSNIGWVNFGANSCGSQAKMVGGALQGWAQATSADNNGWDGCINLSGTGGGSSYGPSIAGGVNQSGTFNNSATSNYAWGSDVVGWIDFSQVSAVDPNPCLFNGFSVPSGNTVTAYQSSSVTSPATCASISQTRTCANGTLSGSYAYSSCNVIIPSGVISSALTATPSRVHPGKSTTLTWSTTSMKSCVVTSSDSTQTSPLPYSATNSPTGGLVIPNITHAEMYTLSCTDNNSTLFVSQVQVKLVPVVQEL
jgi:hypothetical protein